MTARKDGRAAPAKKEYTSADFRAGRVPGFPKGKQNHAKKARRVVRFVFPDRIEIELPVILVSELNEHEHEMTRHRRKVAQQDEVTGLLSWMPRCPLPPPWRVQFTLLAPERLMDDDNEIGAWKHVRDAIARWLGTGDSRKDPITWEVGYEKRDTHGIRVAIEQRTRVGNAAVQNR